MRDELVLALLERLELLAADVGRLRRQRGGHLVDRVAWHVESLDAMVHASAGELTAQSFPGDDEAAAAAIELVDKRSRKIRRLLGERKSS